MAFRCFSFHLAKIRNFIFYAFSVLHFPVHACNEELLVKAKPYTATYARVMLIVVRSTYCHINEQNKE
ncbi:hypothetical protein T03_7610 [Trichinella britovi]|uniref:Uncharacterized protein n=2 Tax=Trichinella TaxID=6333 RepID=A0A0V1CLV2_TRIBR|nr:hypothetical protein T05_11061 [Trichinella murrelli]KRX55490.1 hypothetical protein T09_2492 [Trichinella sp. T9]KRY50198.1 hypothetical protein T03_7610 [Trichinella britovi]KRZ90183.1 hypothetical protein T08_4523 [Trichinella sp. T8]